jgi:hypothetical protein
MLGYLSLFYVAHWSIQFIAETAKRRSSGNAAKGSSTLAQSAVFAA